MSEIRSFQTLVAEWKTAYDAFFAALEALPADKRLTPGICGEWNAKQMVDHLAGWHYEAVRRYAEFAAGNTEERQYYEDTFNEIQVDARRHLFWEETVDDLREVIAMLHLLSREMPDHNAQSDARYAEWLTMLTNEARHHMPQIEAWLPD